MKVLVAIPHFFDPDGGGRHSSRRAEAPHRAEAVRTCIASLHETLGPAQVAFDIAAKVARPANERNAHEIEVVVVTTGTKHLLGDLALPPGLFRHEATDADGWMLGFECRRVLAEGLGRHDVFAFLEDDLSITDTGFLRKLAWFRGVAGEDRVLQANRFEADVRFPAHRAYIDGDLPPSAVAPFVTAENDPAALPDLEARVFGDPVRFVGARNPHAASWFLSAGQMERLAATEAWRSRDTSFVGPLESAITLPLLRTFRIYKPAPENASFLELRHAGNGFLSLLRPLGD